MSEYFQVDVVERADRELVLRVSAIDGNANAYHVERNFACLLVRDADWEGPLARDLARQLGLEEDDDGVDAREKGLAALACQYLERVAITATENLNPSARKNDRGSIGWTEGDGIGSSVTYRLVFTAARWIEEINAGDSWTSAAYDTSYGEEFDRSYEAAVVEREGARIVLRVKPIYEHADPVSDSARFALGVLVERAEIAPLTFSLPAMEVQEDDVMNAAAPEYIESVTVRETEDDVVTLEVVVTDPAHIAAFEPGMRWAAFGFA